MDQEILKVFFYDMWCEVVMHFSAWSGEIVTVIETITADILQTVWNELDFVLMFVESQRVHIENTCKLCHKKFECCSIK